MYEVEVNAGKLASSMNIYNATYQLAFKGCCLYQLNNAKHLFKSCSVISNKNFPLPKGFLLLY